MTYKLKSLHGALMARECLRDNSRLGQQPTAVRSASMFADMRTSVTEPPGLFICCRNCAWKLLHTVLDCAAIRNKLMSPSVFNKCSCIAITESFSKKRANMQGTADIANMQGTADIANMQGTADILPLIHVY